LPKKNLLILTYDFPPSTGGIARLCNEISAGMQSYYQKVKIITIDAKEVSIPYNSSKVDLIKIPSKRFFSEIKIVKEIRKIKDKDTYDVICGLWHPEALLAFLGGMKNVFILGHGTEFLYGTSKFREFFWLPIYCKSILKQASKVIANSNYTNSLIQEINSKSNSTALPLAVNHKFFSPKLNHQSFKENTIKFSTVSRVLQFKGHDFILETFESLPESIRKRLEWHIAGTGPYLDELKEKISRSSLKKQVVIHGFVPDDKLPDFYTSTDVFILATREQKFSTQVEGFGLVFLEAQSCGLPAIGTNTGGIPDAIDHENGGWLFEQDNSYELKKIIIDIFENPDIVREQSKKARERVLLDYTWGIYCEKLQAILCQ